MTDPIVSGIKRASAWSIVLGVVLIIVLGIVAMMAPLATGIVAVSILAWTAVIGGVAQIIYAFRAHTGGRTALEVILGLVYSIAGFYIMWHPLAGLLTLTLLLGFLLVGYAALLPVVLLAGFGGMRKPITRLGVGNVRCGRYSFPGHYDHGSLARELGMGDRNALRNQHSLLGSYPPDHLARSPSGGFSRSLGAGHSQKASYHAE